ncbi:MAG: protein kinase [Deltaproteobacteria bacterium]|nr:protein kinase [Myxococcales bacterium]MDP3217584.1 protein kinase [Deltaproteobacteria bacterium]
MTDDLTGRRLGRYLIGSRLGQGGMGVVYRAVDESLQRTVALKVLPGDIAADANRRRRFEREARAAAAIAHPCIATIYEVGEDAGRVFIAMELVEGVTLGDCIDGGPMPVSTALRIIRDVAVGLARAHERGIVHRDLKPDNVMVSREGEVKVLDFGLARWAGTESARDDDAVATGLTLPGDLMGTPGYMSPEQAAGKHPDARADVFSLGVVLYEMLTGVRPFQGDTPIEVIVAICRDAPLAPSLRNPLIPTALEHLVLRCLAKRPAERFDNARELLRALDRLDAHELVVAPPLAPIPLPPEAPRVPPLTVRLRRAHKAERPWAKVALAAVALGLAVVAAWQSATPRLHVARPAGEAPATGWGDRPITRDPPPATASAEARRHYSRALRALRDGNQELALTDLEAATTADPDLAAAHLRAALERGVERGRAAMLRALAHREALDARDRAVLDAIVPAYTETHADFAAVSARLAAVAARFPRDVTVLGTLGRVQDEHDLRAAVASYRQVTAVDPGHIPTRAALAVSLAHLGYLADARRELSDCLAASPFATACLRQQALLQLAESDCGGAEATARRWLLLHRDGGAALRILATALAGQDRPLDAVRETLTQARAAEDPGGRALAEAADSRTLAVLEGDFVEATRQGEAAEALVRSSHLEADHATAAQALTMILDERGQVAEAAQVARRFLDEREAWSVDAHTDDVTLGRDPTHWFLTLQARAALLTATAAETAREARRAWWERRHAALPEVAGFVWITQYAAAAETPIQARAALALRPRFGHPPPVALAPGMHFDAVVGRTLLLAGEAREALPFLTRAATSCYALLFPVAQGRAQRDLGVARALTGDAAGACEAWRGVLARWGHATPRSVTGEDARARMAAAGCSRDGPPDHEGQAASGR